jgi:hypothetical protein
MGKKGGGGAADQARKDEQERQARIRAGTERINSIFDGRTIGSGKLDNSTIFDPTAKYYLEDGSAWSPAAVASASNGTPTGVQQLASVFGGGGMPATSNKTPQEQFAGMVSGGKLYSGTEKTSGFNDAYFDQKRQNYINYAAPQLEDQYAKAQKELTYSLARGGLTNSSARAEKVGQLQQLYDVNKQKIADDALSHSTEAKNAVEDARTNLIATLNATGDAEGAASSAINRASALSQPAAYSPLSQLFSSFTAGLGTQSALETANAYAGSGVGRAQIGRYNTGLFGNQSAVQVKN